VNAPSQIEVIIDLTRDRVQKRLDSNSERLNGWKKVAATKNIAKW
jgi:hypothetical protein